MFLSNPLKFFLLVAGCTLIFQACGNASVSENKTVSLTDNSKSAFPFSTKEPEVYQGDVVIDGKAEDRRFVARKGSKWRIDICKNNVLLTSQIGAEKVYSLDHQKKVYAVTENVGGDASSLNAPEFNFFGGTEYREFDDLGIDGAFRKYKVREASLTGEVFIYIDEATGMIAKQEFKGGSSDPSANFMYEMRNLKLEVEDGQFDVPAGYQKVTLDEYRKEIRRK